MSKQTQPQNQPKKSRQQRRADERNLAKAERIVARIQANEDAPAEEEAPPTAGQIVGRPRRVAKGAATVDKGTPIDLAALYQRPHRRARLLVRPSSGGRLPNPVALQLRAPG